MYVHSLLVLICNRRKRAETVVNVITVPNYDRGANDESETESLCATQLIEETSINTASDEILQGS